MVFLFLDTNIIQWLGRFGEAIFDNLLGEDLRRRIKKRHGEQALGELESIRHIAQTAQRGSLPIALSERSAKEFMRSSQPDKRHRLVVWAGELISWWRTTRESLLDPNFDEAEEALALVESARLDFLPDYQDRLLIAEAIVLGCDIFLTLDKKTILRFRRKIIPLGLVPMTPAEFVRRCL